jgi:hypothetical protein
VTSLSVVIFGRGYSDLVRAYVTLADHLYSRIYIYIYIYMDRPTDVETGRSSLIGLRFDIVGREYA